MTKTIQDAVRELDGVWPEGHHTCENLVWHTYFKDLRAFPPGTMGSITNDLICTRPEFEATAARMGYPRVTLRPGDYVRCDEINDLDEYIQIVNAFERAGAIDLFRHKQDKLPDIHKIILWAFGNVCGATHVSKNALRELSPAQVLNATNAQPKTIEINIAGNNFTKEAIGKIMTAIKDMDNWHERGERPPAGTECEILGTRDGSWSVGVIDYIDHIRCVWHWSSDPEGSIHNLVGNMKFRPLRTDRERWVEAALNCATETPSLRYDLFNRIYDALQSGELPTPEAKQ